MKDFNCMDFQVGSFGIICSAYKHCWWYANIVQQLTSYSCWRACRFSPKNIWNVLYELWWHVWGAPLERKSLHNEDFINPYHIYVCMYVYVCIYIYVKIFSPIFSPISVQRQFQLLAEVVWFLQFRLVTHSMVIIWFPLSFGHTGLVSNRILAFVCPCSASCPAHRRTWDHVLKYIHTFRAQWVNRWTTWISRAMFLCANPSQQLCARMYIRPPLLPPCVRKTLTVAKFTGCYWVCRFTRLSSTCMCCCCFLSGIYLLFVVDTQLSYCSNSNEILLTYFYEWIFPNISHILSAGSTFLRSFRTPMYIHVYVLHSQDALWRAHPLTHLLSSIVIRAKGIFSNEILRQICFALVPIYLLYFVLGFRNFILILIAYFLVFVCGIFPFVLRQWTQVYRHNGDGSLKSQQINMLISM